MRPVKGAKHGTVYGYVGGTLRACRCERCTEGWRRYQLGRGSGRADIAGMAEDREPSDPSWPYPRVRFAIAGRGILDVPHGPMAVAVVSALVARAPD